MSNESHMINRFFFLSVAFRTDVIHVGDVIVFQMKSKENETNKKMESNMEKFGVLLLVSK